MLTNYFFNSILSILALSFVVLLHIPQRLSAGVPNTVSYQGLLLDQNDQPQIGPVDLLIRFYDAATEGNQLFEEAHPGVTLANGVYSILIGSKIPDGISDAVFNISEIWLGVSVNSGTELIPRTSVSSVIFALKSEFSEKLVSANSIEPAVSVNQTGNVGIGTATPGEKLEVDGKIIADQFIGDGSALTGIATGTGGVENLGSTTIGADTDANGGGVIAFQTQGNTEMTITNDGNVGIGTPSPDDRLEVNGTIKASENIVAGFGTSENASLRFGEGDENTGLASPSSNTLSLITSGEERMRITSEGNVGIGTTDPQELLTLSISTSENKGIWLTEGNGNGGKISYDESGNFLRFAAIDGGEDKGAGINIQRFNGNVGIGSRAPREKLTVFIPEPESEEEDNAGILLTTVQNNAFGAKIFYNRSGEYLRIAGVRNDNEVEAGGITLHRNSGNVGIGTNNPRELLTLFVPEDGDTGILLTEDRDKRVGGKITYSPAGDYLRIAAMMDNGQEQVNGGITIPKGTGNVGIGTNDPQHTLDVNGTIGSGGMEFHSDSRWKKNVETLEHALNTVSKLRGVEYEWRTDEFQEKNFETGKQLGFIAQEVEEVVPQLVGTDSHGYKSLDYARMTAVLVEAMKELKAEKDQEIAKLRSEQQEKFENLQAENQQLRNRLAALEQMMSAKF